MCYEACVSVKFYYYFFFFIFILKKEKSRLLLLHTYSIYCVIFVQLLRIFQPLILQFPIKKERKKYLTLKNFFRFWLHFSVYFANKSFQVLKLVNCLSYPELRIYLWTWLSLYLSVSLFLRQRDKKRNIFGILFSHSSSDFSASEPLYNGRMQALFLVKIRRNVRVFSLFKYLILHSPVPPCVLFIRNMTARLRNRESKNKRFFPFRLEYY